MIHPPFKGAILIAHSQLAHAIAANKTDQTRYAVYYRISHALVDRSAHLGDPFAEFRCSHQAAPRSETAQCWRGFLKCSMIKLTVTDALLCAGFEDQLVDPTAMSSSNNCSDYSQQLNEALAAAGAWGDLGELKQEARLLKLNKSSWSGQLSQPIAQREALGASAEQALVLNCSEVGLSVAMPIVKCLAARLNRPMLLIRTVNELRESLNCVVGTIEEPPVILVELDASEQLPGAELEQAVTSGVVVVVAVDNAEGLADGWPRVRLVHLRPLSKIVQRALCNHFQLWFGGIPPEGSSSKSSAAPSQRLEAACEKQLQASNQVAQQRAADEKRVAMHGDAYSHAEFIEHYGSGDAEWYWERATPEKAAHVHQKDWASTYLYVRPSRLHRFVLEDQLEKFYFISDAAPHMQPIAEALKGWLRHIGTGWDQLNTLKDILIGLLLLVPVQQSQAAVVNGHRVSLEQNVRVPLTEADLASADVVVAALAAVTQPVAKEIAELSTNRLITNGLVPKSCVSVDPKALDKGSFRVLVSGRLLSRWLASARIPVGELQQELTATPSSLWAARTEFEQVAIEQVLKPKCCAEVLQVLPPGMQQWCQ